MNVLKSTEPPNWPDDEKPEWMKNTPKDDKPKKEKREEKKKKGKLDNKPKSKQQDGPDDNNYSGSSLSLSDGNNSDDSTDNGSKDGDTSPPSLIPSFAENDDQGSAMTPEQKILLLPPPLVSNEHLSSDAITKFGKLFDKTTADQTTTAAANDDGARDAWSVTKLAVGPQRTKLKTSTASNDSTFSSALWLALPLPLKDEIYMFANMRERKSITSWEANPHG